MYKIPKLPKGISKWTPQKVCPPPTVCPPPIVCPPPTVCQPCNTKDNIFLYSSQYIKLFNNMIPDGNILRFECYTNFSNDNNVTFTLQIEDLNSGIVSLRPASIFYGQELDNDVSIILIKGYYGQAILENRDRLYNEDIRVRINAVFVDGTEVYSNFIKPQRSTIYYNTMSNLLPSDD